MSSIRLLRTFLAVAAEGSFAAAAPRVALTQAAVGQQMRSLEAELRRPLFERQGKAVGLSEGGRALLPRVHQLVQLYDQLLLSAPAPEPMAGTVHLGAIVSALRPLIESTLALKARHAALELHVSAAKSADLVQRVAAGELDAAVAVRDSTANQPALAWTPLYEEAMVLLVPATLAPAPPRTLLQKQPFIRFDRSEQTGQQVERLLRKLRVRPQEFLELNALEGIVELVRSGLGIALVPLLQEARWQADARLRVVEVPRADARQVALVRRREGGNAAAIAAVAREFKARLAA
ncbi:MULTISPECIES: LysR substrate-binding domain-containing protein [Ramlibacter]|uniref:LysR family transcriptional regulator n=1 Tax=Ramlibacter pinisoli TaxID=2682844 RepID=A0A6N8IX24_9BURK|nr:MULTISPECIES: LysR substrate-binding domain-containing protein [Ramlibacter]MBA2961443.1 LysR family transcriptional regulator [Ramlibacter sp. CGMCC 1.13660]MVQ31387.1 LysR family transcriptional regulator [Ramlibacter pinisoli]